jgi:hypothetical protein
MIGAALKKAQTALEAGEHAQALGLIDQALIDAPSFEGHVLAAACALRGQPASKVVGHLRKAAGLAPFEQVLQRFSSYLAHTPMTPETAAAVGALINASLPKLGAPLARRLVRTRRHINVLGTSHVRFLSGHALFFPLFIGMGPDTIVLTEERFALCRRKLLDNLARVDPAMDVIIVLDSEPYYHAYNTFETRPGQEPQVTEADKAMMRVVCERYESLLADIKARITGRALLLSALPSYLPIITQLAAYLNTQTRAMCARTGTLFIDIWNEIYDPSTGAMRRDLAAQAYNDDTHLGEHAIPALFAGLRAAGVIGAEADPARLFQYGYLHGFPVTDGGETRIWPEADIIPANALRSEKVAAAHVGRKALDAVAGHLAAQPGARVLFVNAMEGYLPLNLPRALMGQCAAVCPSPDYQEIAQRIANFAGRDEIKFTAWRDDLLGLIKGRGFDLVVVNIHPDHAEADLARAKALLGVVKAEALMVIAPDEASAASLFVGRSEPRVSPLGNKHIPERWHECRLLAG